MSVFIAVGEEQSFIAGARRLGLSPPAVTRAIAALEKRIGAKLLSRNTRFVRLTDAGQRYLDSARRILADADEADEAAAGLHAAPRGRLQVTAPAMFGDGLLVPGMVEFLNTFPDAEVGVVFDDRVANLLEEGFDVGIRIGELRDSNLRAQRVGQVHQVVCAAPSYLERAEVLKEPADLSRHVTVVAQGAVPSIEWKFANQGRAYSVRVEPRLAVSSSAAAIAAVRAGFGLTRVMAVQVADELSSGALVPVLASHMPPPSALHIVHGEGRHGAGKVRSFVDVIAAHLRRQPAFNPMPEHRSYIAMTA